MAAIEPTDIGHSLPLQSPHLDFSRRVDARRLPVAANWPSQRPHTATSRPQICGGGRRHESLKRKRAGAVDATISARAHRLIAAVRHDGGEDRRHVVRRVYADDTKCRRSSTVESPDNIIVKRNGLYTLFTHKFIRACDLSVCENAKLVKRKLVDGHIKRRAKPISIFVSKIMPRRRTRAAQRRAAPPHRRRPHLLDKGVSLFLLQIFFQQVAGFCFFQSYRSSDRLRIGRTASERAIFERR